MQNRKRSNYLSLLFFISLCFVVMLQASVCNDPGIVCTSDQIKNTTSGTCVDKSLVPNCTEIINNRSSETILTIGNNVCTKCGDGYIQNLALGTCVTRGNTNCTLMTDVLGKTQCYQCNSGLGITDITEPQNCGSCGSAQELYNNVCYDKCVSPTGTSCAADQSCMTSDPTNSSGPTCSDVQGDNCPLKKACYLSSTQKAVFEHYYLSMCSQQDCVCNDKGDTQAFCNAYISAPKPELPASCIANNIACKFGTINPECINTDTQKCVTGCSDPNTCGTVPAACDAQTDSSKCGTAGACVTNTPTECGSYKLAPPCTNTKKDVSFSYYQVAICNTCNTTNQNLTGSDVANFCSAYNSETNKPNCLGASVPEGYDGIACTAGSALKMCQYYTNANNGTLYWGPVSTCTGDYNAN